MPRAKKKPKPRAPIPRARNTHGRQRQRLIDACISALHIYGPSRTTVEKVVAIAKMSPGIVRFYFASKAAMLVASLQFLATEFEEQLLVPVTRLKSTPVAALELMVDLYLDPEIASPRKVSVWYAFWGEASSRQEYYDICGHMDEGFAALVRELIGQLIIDAGQPHLDPDGVSLGLMGSLEMLWQEFAFRNEGDIDRVGAKRRCMAYLRSVFPGHFAPSASAPAASGAQSRIASWAYDSARLFAAERAQLFAGSWQLAGHRLQIPSEGDFIAPDLGIERALIVRDAGEILAFRNSCTVAPHVLTAASSGHLTTIRCEVHGVQFDLRGQCVAGHGTPDLRKLDMCLVGDLILVRSASPLQPAGSDGEWRDVAMPMGSTPSLTTETPVAADWKLIVEQCLQWPPSARSGPVSWSAHAYGRLLETVDFDWRWRFIAPNHLLEVRPDGFTVLQVLPVAPGRSLLRHYHYTLCADGRAALAAQYLASRLTPGSRRSAMRVAESTQKGLVAFKYESLPAFAGAPQAVEFRQYLLERIPAMSAPRALEGDG